MTDETVVVEVLLRLKQTVSTKSHHRLPLSWGVKQPRSRSRLTAAVSRCDAAGSTRCSPTTPLSWSSGASPSATADGYEDSSRQHHAVRSKVIFLSPYSSPLSVSSDLCCVPRVPLFLRNTVTTARARNILRLPRPVVVLGGSDGLACLTKHSFLLHDVFFCSDNFALDLFIHWPKASGVFKLLTVFPFFFLFPIAHRFRFSADIRC